MMNNPFDKDKFFDKERKFGSGELRFLIGYFNYSVILTYVSLGFALFGMVKAFRHDIRLAVLSLMICGLCDMFDGTIARTCKRSDDEKAFGIQIDSLCDLVCFGVFPVMIGYSIGVYSTFGGFCMLFYLLAALIRLGYFNVQEANRQATSTEKRKYYEGLPVTSVALLIPAFLLIDIRLHYISVVRVYNIGLLLIGLLFLLRFKVRKPYLYTMIGMAFVGAVIFFLVYRYGSMIGG